MTGNEFKKLRQSLGWTQQEMADYMGVWRHTIGLYEKRGSNEVPMSKVMDLAFTSNRIRAQAVEMAGVCDRAAEFIESEIGVYQRISEDLDADDCGEQSEQWREKLTKLLADVRSVSDRLKLNKIEVQS